MHSETALERQTKFSRRKTMEQAKLTDRATVHVIDDDESPREALSLLFPSVGLGVRTYASVHEFVDAGAHDGLGCIVLDVRLPGISGLDFQSRRDEFGVHLPIVLMTGHGDVPMSVRAMKAGAVDFLTKPFRHQDMIDAVSAAIERDRERRAAESAVADIRERYASLSLRRTAGDGACGRRQDEQAGCLRPRPERDHGEDLSRRSDGKDGSADVRRSRAHGRRARAALFVVADRARTILLDLLAFFRACAGRLYQSWCAATAMDQWIKCPATGILPR
jgi:FixJ family two-component response regulator